MEFFLRLTHLLLGVAAHLVKEVVLKCSPRPSLYDLWLVDHDAADPLEGGVFKVGYSKFDAEMIVGLEYG